MVVLVGVVVARSVPEGDDAPSAVDQADRGPVLLVPGYGGSTAALLELRRALPDAELLEPTDDGTGDLRDQAEALDRRVDDVLASSGASSVDLVGYSAGGVVVRYYVAELGGASKVRRVVTLASPHHGTDLAALATGVVGDDCPEACQQLDPDSDLLARLNAGDETPPGPTWVALWTADDRTVVPPSSGSLDGADVDLEVQSLCPGLEVPHGEVPSDPTVVALVVDLLAAGPPETPTTCPA